MSDPATPQRHPYRPQRIKGKHSVTGRMVQVIGGKRWSLVLMWDMERTRTSPPEAAPS